MNYLRVHWNLIRKDADQCDVVDRLEKFFEENPDELQEFITVWSGIWLKKWGERVKLLIGNENSKKWNNVTKILNNADPIWARLSNRSQMVDIVISTLIRNGEICGTSILAENLLKMELGDEKRNYVNEKEQTLNVVNNALKKARDLTQSKGPLIFVKVDKGYYQATQ
jgi:hypothetical protein